MKIEAVYFWAYHFKKFINKEWPHHTYNWCVLNTTVKLARSPYHIVNDWLEWKEEREIHCIWYVYVDNILEEMSNSK
jgi:hypothetical protein